MWKKLEKRSGIHPPLEFRRILRMGVLSGNLRAHLKYELI
jgi:hypothetical protein